jgi:hypothetical protein
MKKVIAVQSFKIRFLEKQNEELNKKILETVKEFMIKIFKRGKHV